MVMLNEYSVFRVIPVTNEPLELDNKETSQPTNQPIPCIRILCEANSHSSSQKFLILWKPNFHYRVYISSPFVPEPDESSPHLLTLFP